jgi:pimeloyl-ACP methyl ester carboxylesterase
MGHTHFYIISGLGADERVFSRIKFPENHTHLSWIENKSDESLQSYAARMTAKIEHSNPILIGLSFGGIVAQEIAAMIPVKQLILISTIQTKKEKPWYFSQVAKLELVNYIPDFMLAKPNIFVAYAFSLNAKEDKAALDSCFDNTTAEHIKWAMKQIVNWEGVEYNTPTFQIHSRQDRIFRKEKSQAKSFISGGHFSVYTNADELNEVLVDRFK